MQASYSIEQGISLWEHIGTLSDSAFSTLSLLHASLAEIRPFWESLMAELVISFPVVLHWQSLGYPLESQSTIQKKKILDTLQNQPGKNCFFKVNADTGVISSARCISEVWTDLDIDRTMPSRYNALVMSDNLNVTTETLWEIMKPADKGIGPHHVKVLLLKLDCVVVRLIESDTHAVCQWLACSSTIRKLDGVFHRQGIQYIQASDVHRVINFS